MTLGLGGVDWRDAVRSPIWVDAALPTIALRGVILVYAVLAVAIFRPDAIPHGSLLEIWARWDAPHYFEVARYGYGPPSDPARIVLFPLTPALIATYPMKGGALMVSEGIDRDRAVDESGNQLAVFGRRGARPLNAQEAAKLFLRDGKVYTVTNNPPPPVSRSER